MREGGGVTGTPADLLVALMCLSNVLVGPQTSCAAPAPEAELSLENTGALGCFESARDEQDRHSSGARTAALPAVDIRVTVVT